VPEFILGLDAEAGEIVIDPPPGLLELYLGAQKHAPDDGLGEANGQDRAGEASEPKKPGKRGA